MAVFFQNLIRLKARLEGEAPANSEVPFEVRCECGETVRGIRRSSWIDAECARCGQSVFVLPANPYPATPSVSSEVLGGSFAERLKAVVAELLPARRRAATGDEQKPTKSAESGRATTEVPVRRLWALPEIHLPRIDIRTLLARTFTPFRLLMLAMVAVVGLTIYWMTWQQRLEAAQQTWLKAGEEIEQFLSVSDMVNLEATLLKAIDAGYTLGRQDPEWRLRLNLLRETAAVNSMATSDLLTAFHQVYDDSNRLVDDAEERVREVAESGTFVFDSWLRTKAGDRPVLLMQFPATPGRHAVEVEIPLPGLAALLEQTQENRVLFAARIQSVKAPAMQSRQPWQIIIAPDSFVLMTTPEHCETIGLDTEEESDLALVLSRQKDFVQSSETWEHRATEPATRAAKQTAAEAGTGAGI
ncbi:MAG: hypothetical protein RIK87_03495 [Fuerstiella sp.]